MFAGFNPAERKKVRLHKKTQAKTTNHQKMIQVKIGRVVG